MWYHFTKKSGSREESDLLKLTQLDKAEPGVQSMSY
jgi:hypothetical protein